MEQGEKATFSIREDKEHKLEVHVAGLCYRNANGKIQLLLGHRTPTRKLYPNLWECGGGQVHVGENFPEALFRQLYEEFGIKSRILKPLTTYEINRSDGPRIPGIVFFCVATGNDEINLNHREFSEYRWVAEAECKGFDMIPGIQEQAREGFVFARKYFDTN